MNFLSTFLYIYLISENSYDNINLLFLKQIFLLDRALFVIISHIKKINRR